jgi:membrane protein YdbS with pleckstrin-like domain
VTDERVVDVDFLNLIYREITDANIDKIQDVTVQVGGVTEALFNYGNVLIQTASELPLIEFDNVPRPDKVSRILRNLRIEEEQEKIEGRVR